MAKKTQDWTDEDVAEYLRQLRQKRPMFMAWLWVSYMLGRITAFALILLVILLMIGAVKFGWRFAFG